MAIKIYDVTNGSSKAVTISAYLVFSCERQILACPHCVNTLPTDPFHPVVLLNREIRSAAIHITLNRRWRYTFSPGASIKSAAAAPHKREIWENLSMTNTCIAYNRLRELLLWRSELLSPILSRLGISDPRVLTTNLNLLTISLIFIDTWLY